MRTASCNTKRKSNDASHFTHQDSRYFLKFHSIVSQIFFFFSNSFNHKYLKLTKLEMVRFAPKHVTCCLCYQGYKCLSWTPCCKWKWKKRRREFQRSWHEKVNHIYIQIHVSHICYINDCWIIALNTEIIFSILADLHNVHWHIF